MKCISVIRDEQKTEVDSCRRLAERVVAERLSPLSAVEGVLLSGSVARGDARKGKFGLLVDLTLVVSRREDLDLVAVLGPSSEPYIPYHCVTIEGQGFALEVVTKEELSGIRNLPESVTFAKNESVILFDRDGWLRGVEGKGLLVGRGTDLSQSSGSVLPIRLPDQRIPN